MARHLRLPMLRLRSVIVPRGGGNASHQGLSSLGNTGRWCSCMRLASAWSCRRAGLVDAQDLRHFMPVSPRPYSKCQPRRRQETNDDEGTNIYYCFACAGSCLGRTGAATGCAQIQPGRRSDSTDREQHAGDTRNQDLCRQPVQGCSCRFFCNPHNTFDTHTRSASTLSNPFRSPSSRTRMTLHGNWRARLATELTEQSAPRARPRMGRGRDLRE